ncbi:hypothetical protein DVH24_005730 [Malus domestica]|uniref:Uncharacterized protein n=1 Tax=Malus domestica TaxID=3750 RepID=A0A498IN64_MALDO|nr:hypothetical protein DVH24_005730 [Malus domestica]
MAVQQWFEIEELHGDQMVQQPSRLEREGVKWLVPWMCPFRTIKVNCNEACSKEFGRWKLWMVSSGFYG